LGLGLGLGLVFGPKPKHKKINLGLELEGDDELADVVRVARREGVVVALDHRQREVLRVALAGSAN